MYIGLRPVECLLFFTPRHSGSRSFLVWGSVDRCACFLLSPIMTPERREIITSGSTFNIFYNSALAGWCSGGVQG